MSLTSTIADFRAYHSNKFSQELSDSLVSAAIQQAVRKISKEKPRSNQRINVSIASGAVSINLPADFQAATIAELYRVKTGIVLDSRWHQSRYLNIWGLSSFQFSGELERFREDGRIYVNRGYRSGEVEVSAETLELTTGDAGLYALWLDADETAGATERTVKNFQYDALHQITDAVGQTPAKDTVPIDLRDILLDQTMHIALNTQARQLRREAATEAASGKAGAKNQAAAGFEAQAALYGKEIFKLASIGGAA